MTIASQTRTAGPYVGTGLVSAYPFAFRVFASSDLVVVVTATNGISTTLVLDSDYTVALNLDQETSPGGTITLSHALASGYAMVITSAMPVTQGVSLPNGGAFYPAIIEAALDKLTILAQESRTGAAMPGRAMRAPMGESIADIPRLADRASRILGFDSSGNPLAGTVSLEQVAAAVAAAHVGGPTPSATNNWRADKFTGNGTTTTFTLSRSVISAEYASVVYNGAVLTPADDYTISGTTLTLMSAPAAPNDGQPNLIARHGTETTGTPGATVWIESYGADPSGSAYSTSAIVTAIAALGTTGGTVLAGPGTFSYNAEIQIPPYVNLVGAGLGATKFKSMSATAKLRWIRGSSDGRGGESGGFTLDGNAVAINPMQLDVCVERNFRSIDIHGCVAGGAGIIINGAQNCNFYGVHSQNNSGSNLILDYGAGNNRFHGCELSQAGEWNVRFQQSGPTPEGGFSAGPTSNRFIGCILERAYAASQGMIYHGAGRFNSFCECDFQFAPITTAKSMVVLEKASPSYDSYLLNFHNCNWSGSAGNTTAIECRANTSVHMSGRHSFENHAVVFSVNDAASVLGSFYATLGGVTSYFTNQGGGTQTESNLIRSLYRGQQQYALPAGQSAISVRDETKSFSGVLVSPSRVTLGDGTSSATRYIESSSPYSLKGIKLNDISAPAAFVLSLGAIDIIVTSSAPTQAAPNGSLAINTAGGPGSTFYVRESGAWVAK